MSKEKILNDERFQTALLEIAKEDERDLIAVQQEADECLDELYTDQHPWAKAFATQGVHYLVTRAYEDKIDVNPAGIKKLTQLMRKHPVAFVMTHKTYLDTMILVSTLARYGMPIPFMFGGINMAFTGLKQVGKNTGFIFIRRQFKNDKVYKAALRHFIAFLIDEGEHFAWNIEGTRSRTGKLVWPQMGILKYIMEGQQESGREIKYVPVSIVYDLIPDVKEMTKQGKGKTKKTENLNWFMNYARQLGDRFGRAAIRFGDPVELDGDHKAIIPNQEESTYEDRNSLPRFAFEMIHRANQITPVTTVSLVSHVLLTSFSLDFSEIESRVAKLMTFIENRTPDRLLDRGKGVGKSVKQALNLLQKEGIVLKLRSGANARYTLELDEYLPAHYYANMSSGHLYHGAFVELALMKVAADPSDDRLVNFWKEIMRLRDLFKFEFFYSNKAQFSSEIEDEMARFDKSWRKILTDSKADVMQLLRKQEVFVSESVLLTYLEAYKTVCFALQQWDTEEEFDEDVFIHSCIVRGKELHWQGQIHRLDSISKPFLRNGYRLAATYDLLPKGKKLNQKGLESWMAELDDSMNRLLELRRVGEDAAKQELKRTAKEEAVPGINLDSDSTASIEEEGAHIAAFFDLDRTLINDFSIKRFVQSRLLSGQFSSREALTQFMCILMYSAGNRDFEKMTRMATKGIRGIDEEEFIELGKQVYEEHLSSAIYPESRALVEAHVEKGHKVVIVSAATLYQIEPIADELGIKDLEYTKLEVENGKFTGEIEEMCWGDGKANAAKRYAKDHGIDLKKSYFYTDSIDDYPLLEIVGYPKAVNPDRRLAQVAFEHDWDIKRFEEPQSRPLVNSLRTAMAIGSIYPSVMKATAAGLLNGSQRSGINTAIETIGDWGCKMAGLDLIVKGEQNLEDHRPAIFMFNHQSNVDLFIMMKLIRRDCTGMAKKELANSPMGPLLKALGAVFVDRKDKAKAIDAFKPAVEALNNNLSFGIAPEGTRSKTRKLGAFKKGGFHLAVQTKAPIVPIVIKNAHDAMPKGSNLVRPTTIEIVVLDPVDTSKWKAKTIDDHVHQVREMFLQELEQED